MATAQVQSPESRLVSNVIAAWRPISMGLLLALLASSASLLQPFWAGDLIDRVQRSLPIHVELVMVISLSVASAVLTGAQQLVLGSLTEKSTARWRGWFLKAFFHLPLLSRQKKSAGWYSARLVADPPIIGRFIGSVVVQAIQSIIVLVATVVILFSIDAVSVLIPVGLATLSVSIALALARPAGRRRKAIQEQNSSMSETMATTVAASRILIATNSDHSQWGKLKESVSYAQKEGTRLNAIYSALGPITATFMQMAYASVFVVGGYRVAAGDLNFPQLITFLMMFAMFQNTIAEISTFPSSVSECRAALSHLKHISGLADTYNRAPSLRDRASVDEALSRSSPSSRTSGDAVEFSQVDFAYSSESPPVLVEASFRIPLHRLSVLVGSSGGGKSTVLGLIEGFFPPCRGRVQVLGEQLNEDSLVPLRKRIGYVDQDSTLVSGTVRDNLLFGTTHNVKDEKLIQSLEEVDMWNWIADRGGLGAEVGVSGLSLSGGQRQRLALARALLRNPDLLILDEPTSSLDGVSESKMMSILREVARERTVIMTAHRLSTILEADWIVVLEHGTVAGEGSHDALMTSCPSYREMVKAQTPSFNVLGEV